MNWSTVEWKVQQWYSVKYILFQPSSSQELFYNLWKKKITKGAYCMFVDNNNKPFFYFMSNVLAEQ